MKDCIASCQYLLLMADTGIRRDPESRSSLVACCDGGVLITALRIGFQLSPVILRIYFEKCSSAVILLRVVHLIARVGHLLVCLGVVVDRVGQS